MGESLFYLVLSVEDDQKVAAAVSEKAPELANEAAHVGSRRAAPAERPAA